ncbi:MAG: signal peptide peptidase SppA [Cytophagales bacterium]|nr:MAG: signal peptide peptidase SppA [Cytophagales bacterium]TAF59444.1 MAG: signal peptide peptidase SppA [Cytophagales bacterium]
MSNQAPLIVQRTSLARGILQFIKYTFATVAGIFLFLFLSFFFFALIGMAFETDSAPALEEDSILKLNFAQPITEQAPEEDIPIPEQYLSTLGMDKKDGLLQILRAIQAAKTDDKIKGIYLELSMQPLGWASHKEIRDALLDFKTSRKFIVAYSEMMSESEYYLASVADKVYINPEGGLEFDGLTSEIPFLKGSFEKLGVKPQIFRVGQYKSAVEPFINDKMSDENRYQVTEYLNSLYSTFLAEVAASRKISPDSLKIISSEMLAWQREDFLKYRLVDALVYYNDVEADLRKRMSLAADKKLPFVSYNSYKKTLQPDDYNENKIAVLSTQGDIVSGKGGDDEIGSESMVTELRKLRLDKSIKAVVLRINSPGGSALASDVMWNEIQLLKKEKPVVASMSDLAASGGYYMAMGCNKIVAQPNTITGSIGIFGMLFQVDEAMRDKLGISFDHVSTGKMSLSSALLTKPLTTMERNYMQQMIEAGYETFTTKAAQGRNMPIEELLKHAGGRVWTGTQAKEVGLVDQLGSLQDAVALAASLAKLGKEDYMLKYYPFQKTFLESFVESGTETMFKTRVQDELGPFYPILNEYKKLYGMHPVQARAWLEVPTH